MNENQTVLKKRYFVILDPMKIWRASPSKRLALILKQIFTLGDLTAIKTDINSDVQAAMELPNIRHGTAKLQSILSRFLFRFLKIYVIFSFDKNYCKNSEHAKHEEISGKILLDFLVLCTQQKTCPQFVENQQKELVFVLVVYLAIITTSLNKRAKS